MTVTASLKAKYEKLSEKNQQTIYFMAKLIGERYPNGFKSGQIGEFIDIVTRDLEAKKPTVQRLYYTYITKHTNKELSELATNYTKEDSTLRVPAIKLHEGEKKKQKLIFRDSFIDVHEEAGNYYFVLDELLDILPVSKSNKALKNGLSVKGRKVLMINSSAEQCIDVYKTKLFLQSFIRQLPEGGQKNDIRHFLEKVHQLSIISDSILDTVPAKNGMNKKVPSKEVTNIAKPVEMKVVEVSRDKNEDIPEVTMVKSVVGEQTTINKTPAVEETNTFSLDETEELKTLTKLLNTTIGYLSPDAKAKLYSMAKDKGLVNTVIATMKTLDAIEKDTSLYFVKKIEKQLKECL